MSLSESDPTNGANGNHELDVSLDEIRARLDVLQNDPVFRDATGDVANDNRIDLIRLIMMELLHGNRQRAKIEEEECSNTHFINL